MGIAQAGLAFRQEPASEQGINRIIERLTGAQALPIAPPNAREFDIRRHTDVMVQWFGPSCFIFNHDIAWPLLANVDADPAPVHESLGRPDEFVAFCHYGSGGSYGYAFFRDGKRTRSRLQTTGVPALPPILEVGTPSDLERRWLEAPFYLDVDDDEPGAEAPRIFYQGDREQQVPEAYLTRVMLDDALKDRFGICPWDTGVEPRYRCFRLQP